VTLTPLRSESRGVVGPNGEIVAFYATMREASRAGPQVYRAHGFSGHAVTAGAVEG